MITFFKMWGAHFSLLYILFCLTPYSTNGFILERNGKIFLIFFHDHSPGLWSWRKKKRPKWAQRLLYYSAWCVLLPLTQQRARVSPRTKVVEKEVLKCGRGCNLQDRTLKKISYAEWEWEQKCAEIVTAGT